MAGGPGGREVGRLSIKVVPDTSGLKPKVKAAAEEVEKSVKINLEVELDDGGIREQLDELSRDLKIEIEVNLVGDEQARVLLEELSRQRTARLEAEAETARAAAELARLSRDREVRIRVNTGRGRRGIFAAFSRGIGFLTSQIGNAINGAAQLVAKGLENAFSGATSSVGSFFNSITSSAGKGIAAFGEMSAAIGAAGAIAVAVAAAIVIAYVVAFAAVINAAIAMVAAVVGALVAVAALLALPVAFAAAGLAIALTNDKIRKSFSDTFKDIKNSLAIVAAPVIKALGEAFKELAAAMKPGTPLFLALSEAFAAAASSMRPLLSALTQFGTALLPGVTFALKQLVSGGFMEALGQAFKDIGDGFSDMFSEISASNASSALLAIGRLFAKVAPAIGRFADAMASISAPIIDGLALAFQKLFDGFAENKDDFAIGAQALGDALVKIVPALVKFMAAFSKASPGVIEEFANQIIALLTALSQPTTIQAIALLTFVILRMITVTIQAFDLLARMIAIFGVGLGELVNLFQRTWDQITRGASIFGAILLIGLQTVWNGIKNGVSSALSGIVGAWQRGWSTVVALAQSAWNGISRAVSGGINGVKNAINSFKNFITHTIPDAFSEAVSRAGAALAGLVGIVSGIMNAVIGAVSRAVGTIRNLIGSIGSALDGLPFFSGGRFEVTAGMDPFNSADLALAGIPVEMHSGPIPKAFNPLGAAVSNAVRSVSAIHRRTQQPESSKVYHFTINGTDVPDPETTITRALRHADTLFDPTL